MARTPEHIAPHIPHIPLPDVKGTARWVLTHWPVAGGALLALTGAGLSIQMLTGADRGPQNPPTEPTKASDTIKPPEGGPNVAIISNTTPEPTATVEAQKPTPTPEAKVEAFDCSILSPELCATGEYIEWTRFDGQKLRGIGYILPPGEKVKIPKALQVSKTIINQPNTYHGVLVVGKTRDNSETYQYLANFIPDNLGTKNLPEGTIGIIADNNVPVFQGVPYNLVFIGPDELMKKFTNTNNPPKIINNEISSSRAPGGAVFYDIPAPK